VTTPGRSGLIHEEPLLFERSRPGRAGVPIDDCDVPLLDPTEVLGADLVRDDVEGFPELGELDVVRHYTRLSQWNYSIDAGLYPLGSCTMKYNPKVNEVVAGLPGIRDVHPLAPDDAVQGLLALAWELESALAEISALDRVSLQPAAGAQGEFVGMKMIQAYHQHRGETARRKVLIPDTAHGTNPASAVLGGQPLQRARAHQRRSVPGLRSECALPWAHVFSVERSASGSPGLRDRDADGDRTGPGSPGGTERSHPASRARAAGLRADRHAGVAGGAGGAEGRPPGLVRGGLWRVLPSARASVRTRGLPPASLPGRPGA